MNEQERIPESRETASPLIMISDRVLRISGKGTIVIGTIASEEARAGDRIYVVSGNLICHGVIVGFDSFRRTTPHVAHRGELVGMLLRGCNALPVEQSALIFLESKFIRPSHHTEQNT
jgi:translation elongation factor EF-Tu-like GTPase